MVYGMTLMGRTLSDKDNYVKDLEMISNAINKWKKNERKERNDLTKRLNNC